MAKSNTKLCGICQSRWTNTDCIHVSGGGTVDDPVIPDYNLDDESSNTLTKGPLGLKGNLPAIYRDPPCSSVYATIDQTIPYLVEWPIIFNRRRYDTDNMWDEDDPTKLFFRTEGLYLVTVNLRWNKTDDNSATGHLAGFVRMNQNEFVTIDALTVPNGDLYAHQSFYALVPARAGDYVELLVKAAVLSDVEGPDGDLLPITMRITAERQSPNFTATYLRSLDGLNIPGY